MPIVSDELEIGDYLPGEFVVLDVVRGASVISAYVETVTGAKFYRTWPRGTQTQLVR